MPREVIVPDLRVRQQGLGFESQSGRQSVKEVAILFSEGLYLTSKYDIIE